MKVKLYIENELLDLHEDETIIINSSVQNVKDISKIFTDFSQSISVPASKNNNRIFKHFYDAEITNGYDYRTRKDSFIEIDTLPFKVGKMQLEGVDVENNKPKDYKIRFYGSLVKLTDLFGEDKLTDLDLTAYNHEYISANVVSGFGSGIKSGNVIYPLISKERNWLWDSDDIDDIEYASATLPSTTNGIVWDELSPAIKLARLIDAIEVKYSITFTADFFGTTDFEKLFLWASNNKGDTDNFGTPELLIFDPSGVSKSAFILAVPNGLFDYHSVQVRITPQLGSLWLDYPYLLTMVVTNISGNIDSVEQVEKTGIYEHTFTINSPPNSSVSVSFYISSTTTFLFKAEITTEYLADTGSLIINSDFNFADTTIYGILSEGRLPKIQIKDFLTSLIKQNNLVVVPTDTPDEFYVNTLDAWYLAGTVYDISKYINKGSYNVGVQPIMNKISFKYQEGETILNERYRETNKNIGYGDLEAEFTNDGGKMEIEIDFENVMLERLTSQQTGADSEVHVGKIIDIDLESVDNAPFIFYNRGLTTISGNGYAFIDDMASRSEIKIYNNIGQENHLTHESITQTLHFGAEISTWTLRTCLESLYANRYEDYVTDLFSAQRRIFKYKAILPDFLISKIKLNDKLIIDGRKHIINEMKINLTTNEVDFELLNDIY